MFPHLRSLGEPDELEEERRLAYVGHHPGPGAALPVPRLVPDLWGQTQYNPPSRFLKEIPDALVTAAAGGRRPAARAGASGAAGTRIVEAAMRRGKVGPVHGTGAELLGLRAGENVVHAKWGEGVVHRRARRRRRAEARVRFPSVGEKHLALSLAPIKRA